MPYCNLLLQSKAESSHLLTCSWRGPEVTLLLVWINFSWLFLKMYGPSIIVMQPRVGLTVSQHIKKNFANSNEDSGRNRQDIPTCLWSSSFLSLPFVWLTQFYSIRPPEHLRTCPAISIPLSFCSSVAFCILGVTDRLKVQVWSRVIGNKRQCLNYTLVCLFSHGSEHALNTC